MPDAPPTQEQIQDWIVVWLAKELECAPTTVDVNGDLDELGVSSRQAVSLTADLGDWIGLDLAPNIFFKHRTVLALSRHLSEAASRPR